MEVILPLVRAELGVHSATRSHNAEQKLAVTPAPPKQPAHKKEPSKRTERGGVTSSGPGSGQIPDKDKPVTKGDKTRQKEILDRIYLDKFDLANFKSQVGPNCCVFHNFALHQYAIFVTQKKHIARALEQGIRQSSSLSQSVSSDLTTLPPKSYVAAVAQANQVMTPELSVIDLLGFSNLNTDEQMTNSSLTKVDPYFCLTTTVIDVGTTRPECDKFIVNSGPFPHMVNNLKLFTHMRKWPANAATGHVLLANGNTKTKISGVGTVPFSLPNSTVLEIENVLYVPTLSSSIFSIRQQIAYDDCHMRSQGNTLQLIFSTFTIDTAPDNFSFPCCSTTSPPHYASLHRPNNVHIMCNKVTLPRRSPRLSKTIQTTPPILRNEPLKPSKPIIHNLQFNILLDRHPP